MRVEAEDIRNLNVLKHYRTIRKWAHKTKGIREADLEILIYLDCLDHFRRVDFQEGTFAYSWDKGRWDRLRNNGWVEVWRTRNNTTRKFNLYKVTFKGKQLINQIYRIMLGQEDLPSSTKRNPIMKGETYMDKVLKVSIDLVNKDETR
jgi:hypothetical protein